MPLKLRERPLADEYVLCFRCSMRLTVCLSSQEMASIIRKHLKDNFAAHTWHVFVGRKFSSFVTFKGATYIYFYLGQVGVVAFAS